ncbi:MAG TPA: alpha/beta hydrolase [Acidimicrobiales bacterium]|nr:alpha/beta hydrolase [Acidimicrobiales bacterium]
MTTVMLVHGAFHGSWCFDEVAEALGARGVPVVAPELPLTSNAEDAAVVRRAIDEADDEIVLLGHSYGGAVISRAAVGAERVRHLVYLCALMVEGSDLPPDSVQTPAFAEAVRMGEEWTSVDPAGARAAFYADCPPAVAEASVARLRPMPTATLVSMDSGRPAAWRSIPSTYVVCTLDQTIHPQSQRAMAAQATESVEWEASHSPFLSRPDLVVDLLAALAARP